MSLINLLNVSKSYGKGRTRVDAIKDITLEIDKGEFVVILGKSGSGKSTLLSLISGLEKPDRGLVEINNTRITELNENQLAIIRRHNIGFIFQHFHLINAMTALENTELPAVLAKTPKKERQSFALKLLELVGLSSRLTHYPEELSGGERQRTGIARSLINKPGIIIADEPTGDLDNEKGKEIVDLLYNLNQGIEVEGINGWKPTIIMVTHDKSMIKDNMRVITLSDGEVLLDSISNLAKQ